MEHAKRMVLVDEKMLDNMWRKQDISWKRPTDQTVKHSLSRQMRNELDDVATPDDVKAKQYQQILSRFLNTKRKLPDAPLIDLNPSPSNINDLIGLDVEVQKKKKQKIKSTSFPIRHSKRKVKPPKK